MAYFLNFIYYTYKPNMKNLRTLSYLAIVYLATCLFFLPVSAQDSTAVKDTSIVIPFPALPVNNIKAVGNKKTGELVISMDFENKWPKIADASLDFGGWSDFGFTTDKGHKYAVPLYYDRLTQDNPNLKYKPVKDIQYGAKKMTIAPILPADLEPKEKITLTIRVPNFDKAVKIIREFHVLCHYVKRGVGGTGGDGLYKIRNLAVEWK